MATGDFLGVGFKFPFEFDELGGGVARTSDQVDGSTSQQGQDRHIAGAIEQILLTNLGERFMVPEFGTTLRERVFDPSDASLLGLLAFLAGSSIERWDKRVVLDSADAFVELEEGKVLVVATFRVVSTNQPGNVVVPFADVERPT